MTDTNEPNENDFDKKLKQTLEITQNEISSALEQAKNISIPKTQWDEAKKVVEQFQPVPWFIWRLAHFVFGKPGRPNNAGEGMVLGLKKVLLAAASDKVLGKGEPVTRTRDAIKAVRSDVVAATSVIHSISRKLTTKQFSRVWEPILEDAITRAHIGYFVGQMNLDFGPGRGMLAGFAGRIGLAILIANGTEYQAELTLQGLSQGKTLREVGLQTYGADPLQVSAMVLSACGCGKEAAIGTVAYANESDTINIGEQSFEQKQWLAAFIITENARMGQLSEVKEDHWKELGFYQDSDKEDLAQLVKLLIRKGHGWEWIV